MSGQTPSSLRVAVSGTTGLIGRRLVDHLQGAGHRVHPLVRRQPKTNSSEIRWDPQAGDVDAKGLDGLDAVIHLAGENIASGRWNDERKAAIRDSRVLGTTLLAEALANVTGKPRVLVCSSAIGYYGDRGDEPLTEDSAPGRGFLADVCQQWEAATDTARDAGIRVVNVRTGVVLSKHGGALERMLPIFRKGLGGRVGSGKQYVSWISHDDIVRVLVRAMTDTSLAGPVNATAPYPVTNAELTETLGAVLDKPARIPAPAFAIKLALGEMGQALLLASTRVLPKRLEDAGFAFEHTQLRGALRAELAAGT